MPPPPPIPTNLSNGGGNINTFAPRTQPGAQPSLDGTSWKKNVHKQARKAIANFWYILTSLSTIPKSLFGSL